MAPSLPQRSYGGSIAWALRVHAGQRGHPLQHAPCGRVPQPCVEVSMCKELPSALSTKPAPGRRGRMQQGRGTLGRRAAAHSGGSGPNFCRKIGLVCGPDRDPRKSAPAARAPPAETSAPEVPFHAVSDSTRLQGRFFSKSSGLSLHWALSGAEDADRPVAARAQRPGRRSSAPLERACGQALLILTPWCRTRRAAPSAR